MAQFTGGKVSFSRTVQPAPYESKNASVEISFMLDPNDDMDKVLEQVGYLAEDRALAMVGLKRKATKEPA